MEKDISVYVSALHTSLREKSGIMQSLLELTQEQEQILKKEEIEIDDFDKLVQEKSVLLDRMSELDKGFQNLFDKIGTALKENKMLYKGQVQEMQEFIGITSREHFRKIILKPLLEAGKIKMTLPNKPNSKNQKYIKA